MVQEKVAGLMSTGLDINATKATESLNSLKSAVRDSVNEWKQMESQMKQAGDTVGASEAKYKGLTESVNKQQTVLEKLRQEQAEVNRSTEAGEQTYQKYATQITAAERQLATMTQQQEQAKRAYELQKSGIAGLNKEIQNSIKETDAYVERLKAEGKEEEALKAQKEGLSRTLDKQTQLYEVQTKQLDKMIKSGDASADSISKQKIALDKTATAIAKGKRSLEELNLEQSNVGKNNGASEAGGKFEKLTGTVGQAKLGLVAMGATAGAVLASVTKLVDTIYDQQSQVNALQAKTTSSYKESKEGIQAINKLYVQGFGESLDELQETYIRVKQLNPSDSIQDLTEKTKLASTYAKQSGADIQEVLAGASKATTNLGISYEEYFDLMATASKKGLDTQGALSDEMAEYSQVLGQMGFSAKEAFGLLENGLKAGAYNTDKLSDFVKEFGISLNDGRMQDNIGAFSKNTQQMFDGFKKGKVTSAEMLKAVTQDLAGMTDKQKEATLASNLWSALGEDNALKVVESMGQVNNSFDNVQGTAKKTAEQLKNQNPFELAKRGAKTFTSELTLNQDQVKKLKEAFAPLAKALKELFESVVKNLPIIAKSLTPVIDFTAKYLPLLISGLGTLAGLWGVSKIVTFGSSLTKVGENAKLAGGLLKGAFTFLKANPLGLLITGVTLATTALVSLYKHNEKFREFVNGILKSAKSAFDKLKDVAAPIIQSLKIFGNTIKEVFVDSFKAAKKAITPFIKIVKSAFSGLDSEFGDVFKSIGKTVRGFLKPFSDAGKKGGAIQSFADALDGVSKWFIQNKSLFITIGSLISKTIGTAFSAVGVAIRGLLEITLPLIKPAFNIVVAVIKGALSTIKNAFKIAWNGIKLVFDLLTLNWKNLGNDVKGIAKGISGVITSVFKTMGAVVSNIFKALVKVIDKALWSIGLGTKPIENFVKGTINLFKNLWKNATNIFGDIANFIGNTISNISKTWNRGWNSIFNFFGNVWDRMGKYGRDAVNGISRTIHNVLGAIDSVWRRTWQGLGDFFGGIWRNIKGFAQDGINGVLKVINAGVDGIDSVWKFFTGKATNIRHLQPVRFAQGGIVERRMVTSMVNDGAGPDWKELIELPDGKMVMSQKRNAILPLPVGTRVYNGKETKAIMNMAGIQKYANGGIVGGAINWAKGTLSNVGSWIGDKLEAIDKFLKNPVNAVKGLISKATSGMLSGLGNFGQLATGTFDKLSQSIADWFTKGLKKVQEENQDGGGGRGAPAGAGVSRWTEQVKAALSANGLSTSQEMVNKVLRQIQTESGGNERAVQGGYTDINTITGDLAKGLMQTISATFNAFKFPGHGNIFNGYDNLLAALNYAKHRYGPNLSYLGQGHGYENGGIINTHGLYEIAEKNKPEMVIPLAADKRVRANQLLNEANQRINGVSFETQSGDDTISKLEAKFDSMIALLAQLVQGQNKQTTHVVLDKNALYRQQASDTNLRNIQSLA